MSEYRTIDKFLELAQKAEVKERDSLEKLGTKISPEDDWLVDDFAELEDFVVLSSEFAIVGLWRCVELYGKRTKKAIRFIASQDTTAATKRVVWEKLLDLDQSVTQIRCSKTVIELRELNNAIKHTKLVDGDLAELPRWRNKKGSELGNLKSYYPRLRTAAERYLNDLSKRLSS